MATLLRIAAIFILIFMGAMLAVQVSTPSWPSTKGRVIQGGWASENRSDAYVRYGVYEVRYEFEVSGQRYESVRMGFDTNKSVVSILNDSDKIERQPREGDEVNVFYLPQYPAISVLIKDVSPRVWIWTAISLLAVVGLFAWSRIVSHPIY
jgi:hypothetical protein